MRDPTVLVIEDDQSTRQLIGLHLRNHGYDVTEAEDAVDGGYALLASPPDVVICDVNMPYLNGYEFVAALKGDPATSSIPVVILTVNDDVADRAEKLGVAYLQKPISADSLLHVVGRIAHV